MHQPIDDGPTIKFIRMNTGEDIIAQIVKPDQDDEEYYVLINPLKILYTMSETQGISIALMQWIFPRICDSQEFPVYSNDIITMCSPSKQMQTYYWNVLNKFDDMGLVLAPTNRKYQEEEEEYEYDDIEPTEEELEYINKMLEDVKNGKRKLH